MDEYIKPVVLKNRNGKNLFGMLHTPKGPAKNIGLIILSPGIKSRVGPHRLYVKMAELFTQMGFTVLRADPEGLGDSEGEINHSVTADVYGSIELGLFVSDTIDMMDWMARETGYSSFILAGLCGGAITALLASEKDPRVKGILSLGMTCILTSANIDPAKYITVQQLNDIRESYLKKVLDPRAWFRFLSLKSDYKLLLKALMQPLHKKRNKRQTQNIVDEKDKPRTEQPFNTNLNPHFHRTFLNFIEDKKILLIFSGADRLYWEFEEKYLEFYKREVVPYSENFQISIVKNANHVFSFHEWQNEMFSLLQKFLTKS